MAKFGKGLIIDPDDFGSGLLDELLELETGLTRVPPTAPAATAAVTRGSTIGSLFTKGAAFAKAHPFKAGLGALGPLIGLLSGARAASRSNRKREELEAYRVPTAESVFSAMQLRDELSRRMANMDPETTEQLRWLLSGQQQPDLTPNEIMLGDVPTNSMVSNEEMRSALAMMLGVE